MVTVNTNDLEFILQQIKIAEADARGEQILGGVLPNTEVPWGLRRVDGSNNNLFPGQETYGAGRFLNVPRPVDSIIVLDFNRAYNPPCAFNPFTLCPVPPAENHLAIAITAGALKPVKP